jgi:excisionase family DNA binding protein
MNGSRSRRKDVQDRLLLGMKEAGESLSCSPWTVRKLIYSGRLVGVKIGTRLCVERAELERFVNENRTRSGVR